jgi:hypothetical protein
MQSNDDKQVLAWRGSRRTAVLALLPPVTVAPVVVIPARAVDVGFVGESVRR